MISLPYQGPCKKEVENHFPELVIQALPPIDDLVILFLAEHDVHVTPPGGRNVAGDAFRGAITGAMGAEVAGLMHIEKNQRATALLQEWTSWKQWALGHSDWKAFKQSRTESIEQHNANAYEYIKSPDVSTAIELFAKETLTSKNAQAKSDAHSLFKFIGAIAGVCVLCVLPVAFMMNKSLTPSTTSPNESSSNVSSIRLYG